MRVTENTNFETVRGSVRRSKERMENLQTQNSTLKKLNTPSDNPIGSSRVLELRTDKMNNDQFQMNGKMAETFLANSEQAIGELGDIMIRAKEIAIGQASGASANKETRVAVAEEVSQLYQQAVATANRRVGERYLFGGYKTQAPPVDADGRYRGDEGQMMLEVSKDVYLSMNIPGLEVFNTQPKASADYRQQNLREGTERQRDRDGSLNGGQRAPASALSLQGQAQGQAKAQANGGSEAAALGSNANIFNELQTLRISLLTGDEDGIRNTLERFDELHGRLNAVRAKVGSRMQGLQTMGNAIERHNLVNAQLSSSIEDADMAQVVSDLAKEESVYRSALSSAQKLIQPTLMDFIK